MEELGDIDFLDILVRAIIWYAGEPIAPALALIVLLFGLVAGGETLDRLNFHRTIQPIERDIIALILGSVVGGTAIVILNFR